MLTFELEQSYMRRNSRLPKMRNHPPAVPNDVELPGGLGKEIRLGSESSKQLPKHSAPL